MPTGVAEIWGKTRRGFVVCALAAALLAAVPGTASAELTDLPDKTWGVVGLYDSLTTSTPAEVMAIEQIGNTIYVGGQFLEVVRKRNEPHHDQRFLAAFDATTGDWIDWWRPQFNGPVFALEASADGSRLYVGGEFTDVDGIGDTAGVVAVDPATGMVDTSFTAEIEGASSSPSPGVVRTIRATSSWVYIGGSFNFVTGPDLDSRLRVNKTARLSSNGTPDPTWKPKVLDGAVWGLDVDESRNRVYLAGFFESIDNIEDTANFIAVSDVTGQPYTTFDRFPILTPTQPHQFEVLVDGDNVWVVGTQHVIHKLNASDLSMDRRWFTGFEAGWHIGGDFQAIGILDDEIYATCHCWGVIRELPNWVETLSQAQTIPVDGEIQGIIGFDRTTGEWNTDFVPDIFGQIGGWAVNGGGDGCLWVGGDLNRRSVGDTWRNGIVRWCDEAGQGPPVGPPLQEPPDASEDNRPTRPSNPSATGGGGEITLSWGASSDDTYVATYVVYRNGIEESRTRRTEIELPAGGPFAVQAVDPWGNGSHYSDPITAGVVVPPELGYWPLDGTALDMSGNENHGTASGTRNVPGRVVDAQRLASGDAVSIPANEDLQVGDNDSDFSISAWLRLESGPTGVVRNNITAAGVAQLGTASNTNQVIATIETAGGDTTAVSNATLSTGVWTHIALVRKGNDMKIYIDGALDKTKALGGSTSAGSGAMTFTGDTASIDDVKVHGGALSTAQVGDLTSPDFPEALWAYYPFDGNADDESGNGFDGVVTGTETVSGVHGQALSFDGSASDEVQIADDPALRPGDNDDDFTVSFWMNLQTGFTGAWRSLAHKGNNGSERTFAMWMRPFDNRIHYRISTDVSSNEGENSSTHVAVGEWTHITYVKRGNKLAIYFNGVLDDSITMVGDSVANDGDIYIGDAPWYNGSATIIDDFRIYEHGFHDDEVLALAGATPPPDPAPEPADPIVGIARPTVGDVTKTVTVKVNATSAVDDPGDLNVDVKVGGSWKNTSYNAATRRYEYVWDTTQTDPGPVTVRARATESTGNTTTSTVDVEVKAHYPTVVLGDGAVAYWRLNDGGAFAKDSVDGSHKAQYNGTDSRTPPLIGEGGKSATFDGVDDIITVNNHIDINTAASYPGRSIELWFEAPDTAGRHVLWEEGGKTRGISVYLKGGNLWAGAWNRSGPDAWAEDVFVTKTFDADVTYHVVVTIAPAGGKLRLFMNGEKVRTKAGVEALVGHSGAIGLGARNGSVRYKDTVATSGTGAYLDGIMDEIAIYNSVLTQAQVQAHYSAAQD
ncbi:MAG: LamG domain-containing protein [Acidimicrobiia bacterium]|nr:LamG domain-containing protein [Acidimicrobiia bacterium]